MAKAAKDVPVFRPQPSTPTKLTQGEISFSKLSLPDVLKSWMNVIRIGTAMRYLGSERENNGASPLWVVTASKRIQSMGMPTIQTDIIVNMQPNDLISPQTAGALLGHAYACGSTVKDWMLRIAAEPGEQMAKAHDEAMDNYRYWTQQLRDLLKLVEEKAVGYLLQDAANFWLGFSDAVKKGSINSTTGMPAGESLRLEILLTLIENWEEIEKGRTSESKWSLVDLDNFLKKKLNDNTVGSLERLEKICQDIGLRFRRGKRTSRLKR